MQLVDDTGRALDAEYPIKAAAIRILSWKAAAACRADAADPDDIRALAALLGRLGGLHAVLVDALVDSRYAKARGKVGLIAPVGPRLTEQAGDR